MTSLHATQNHILSPDGVIEMYRAQGQSMGLIGIQVSDALKPERILLDLLLAHPEAVESLTLISSGFRVQRQNQEEVETIDVMLESYDLYTVGIHLWDTQENKTLKRHVVAVTNPEMEHLLGRLLSNQNDKSSAWPMLSPERFMIFNTDKSDFDYTGKRIFLSGCGSGAESPALLALGAAEVYAHDLSPACLDFCRARFGGLESVKPVSNPDAGDQTFDFVISRHVIEHVPARERQAYMASLCKKLEPNGRLILDVPNQKCPIEPHTDIAFFHLLDRDAKLNAIRYFESAGTERERAQLPALRSLINHTNLAPHECAGLVPEGFRIEQLVDIYPRVPEIDVEIAGTFRLVVARA